MAGPYPTFDAIPAPEDLAPHERVGAAVAPAAPYLAVELHRWGDTEPADHALCLIAARLGDGWYASVPFACGDADNRTSTVIALESLTVHDGEVALRYRSSFEGWNMDDDGLHLWEQVEYEMTCAVAAGGKPACAEPVPGHREGGSEPLADAKPRGN